jgi:hypothetical protein
MKLSEKLVKITKDIIYNPAFKEMARKSSKFFTRNRKMPFEDLVIFMLFHLKCSIPSSLRRYFKIKEENTTMSQQSLSEAREKLTVDAFKYLYRKSIETIIQYRTLMWHGYRIYANDGSKITLPDDAKLLRYYGAVGRNVTSPTAQASAMYDVLNDTLVDVEIAPITTDERKLALQHINATKDLCVDDKKLNIYDRGYASFDFIKELETLGLFYLMRVKTKFNADIDAQTATDGYVWIEKDGKRIHVRVIKFELNNGETETLITNITDKRLGKNAFKKLYFMRWPIETKYGVIKKKLQLENFSARSVEGIQQEFFASMYLTNFVAAAAFDIQSDIKNLRKDKPNKYEYKANVNELIGILKDKVILAIAETSTTKQAELMNNILEEAKRFVVPIRSDRTVYRNPFPRDSDFHHNQKVNC